MDLPRLRRRGAPIRVSALRVLGAGLLMLLVAACATPADEQTRPTIAPGQTVTSGGSAVASTPLPAPPAPPAEATEAPAPPPTAADLQAALDRARIAHDIPGAELGIAVAGGPIWSGGSGSSWQLETLVTDETPFVIGSITKTFVAALVLQLVDEGRLALDDVVSLHLPELGIADGVSVGQLLTHTSGLADVWGPPLRQLLEQHPDESLTNEQLLSFVGEPWGFPGATFSYSNTNYLLLGMIVEKLTGATLDDELQRRFIDPLGLASTTILWRSDHEPTPLLSRGWASAFKASGSMTSTAADLVRWAEALYGGELLSPAGLDEMLTFGIGGYGMGSQRLPIGGYRAVGHTGLLGENTALLLWLPDEQVALAIMADRPRADLSGMLLHEGGGQPSVLELVLRLAEHHRQTGGQASR